MVERLHPRIEEITSRQLEVARLVAEGRTNPEIAAALGITLDGAKYHVSELLGRLGLERREEIRQWYRSERRARRVRGLSALLATAPRAFATAAAVTAVVAVGGLFALGLSGGRAEEVVTPTATATPTATPPLEPGVAPPLGATGDASDLPRELDWLPVALGARLRAAPPEVVSWERVDWFDGCFDIDVPGGCPLSVSPVPGYRVVMDLDGAEYIARTAVERDRYALEAAPPIAPFEPVYEWIGTASDAGFLCLDVKLAEDGQGSIAGCGEAPTLIDLDELGVGSNGFLEHVLQFHGFERSGFHGPTAQPSVSTVTLSAGGDRPAVEARQRAAQEWGLFLAIESYTGHGSALSALALGWQDAEAQVCQNVQVEWFGALYRSNCPDGDGVRFLDDERLTQLYEWLDTYAPFEARDGEDFLVMSGRGIEVADDGHTQHVAEWVAETLAAEGGPTASE